MDKQEFPVIQIEAPLTTRGYIRFVNIRPDRKSPAMWICDVCGERSAPSKHETHARVRHGWSS